MKNLYLVSIMLTVFALSLIPGNVKAGNEQRTGSNGAALLLLNPWSRSSGWGDANVACVTGVDAIYQNVAGMALISKTELSFNHSIYLEGSGMAINNGGFATKVGETGVLGVSIMSLDYGDIEITTEELPEGGIGTFSPSSNIIGLSYAREFSRSIYGGITVKMLSESIHNVSANGFAIDAGIQYSMGVGRNKTGEKNRDNLKFGITMKNVGTTMKFEGDGMSFSGFSENGTSMTLEQRSQLFELPSLIKIGFSYHLRLAPKIDESGDISSAHNLAIAANFTSNSYNNDQYHIGGEYGFKNYFFLRGGYIYEPASTSLGESSTVFTGLSFGMSLQAPINKNSDSVIGVDYSYRETKVFGGMHTIGLRVTL